MATMTRRAAHPLASMTTLETFGGGRFAYRNLQDEDFWGYSIPIELTLRH